MQSAGPRKIIDLDVPEHEWKIETEAIHIYHGKLWKYEQAGCVMCVECERNDAHGQTLSLVDNPCQFICLTHGDLEEVPYNITRVVTVKIGDVTRIGSQSIRDSILIPVDLDVEEREELLDRLITAAADSESDPEMDVSH